MRESPEGTRAASYQETAGVRAAVRAVWIVYRKNARNVIIGR